MIDFKKYTIVRLIVIAIFAILSLLLSSCQSAGASYIDSMNASLEVIIPHHIEYLKADTKLSEVERETMVKSSTECLELSREAKKQKDSQK